MKLSKKQADVLWCLREGIIYVDLETGEVSLEDGDGNVYHCRRDTVQILVEKKMIEPRVLPSMSIAGYALSKVGEKYLDAFPLKQTYEESTTNLSCAICGYFCNNV